MVTQLRNKGYRAEIRKTYFKTVVVAIALTNEVFYDYTDDGTDLDFTEVEINKRIKQMNKDEAKIISLAVIGVSLVVFLLICAIVG